MRKYFFSILAVGYTVVITILSLVSLKGPEVLHFSSADKIAHIVIYCLFAIIWFLAFTLGIASEFIKKNALYISISFAFIYGILIEVMQENLVVNRQGDWKDALANTIGIILAIFILKWFIAKNRKLKTQN